MVSPNSIANLRKGNPGNRGRPRAEIRDAYLKICEESAEYLAAVAAGKKVIEVLDGSKRKPTLDERLKAITVALRYGLGTNEKVEAIEDSWEMEPSYKVYLDFEPESAGIGGDPMTSVWEQRGKTYFRIPCEDGGELTYRLPKDAKPLLMSTKEALLQRGIDPTLYGYGE